LDENSILSHRLCVTPALRYTTSRSHIAGFRERQESPPLLWVAVDRVPRTC